MAFGTTGQPVFGTPNPQNPAAILAQIDQFRQAGRLADAERLARGLVLEMPNSPVVLNVLGLLVRARGEQKEAESLMRRAIAAAPKEAALHNNLGNILFSQNDPQGAESAYRKAISLKADYPEALHNLGIVLKQQGRIDEALVAQRRAVALRPGYAQALVQVGALLCEKGEAGQALAPLEAAAKAQPDYYDALYYRGTALLDLERFDEALPVLRSTVALAPDRHEARYACAKALAHLGQEETAMLAYQTVFEKKPDFIPALEDFTSLAWSMGNGARSLAGFEYARGKVGETADLLLAEANLRLRFTDDISIGAEAMLRRAHNMAPERADITNALARSMVLQGRYEQSFPLFQEAIKAEPAELKHRHAFAEALLAGGEHGEARTAFQDALSIDPHDQIALAGLTLAYRELGDSRYDDLVDLDRFVRAYEIAPPTGFNGIASFNRALAEELERLHTRHAPPLDQTLRHGTQTAGTLFKQPSRAIEAVREQIAAAVADYVAALPDDASHPLLARKNKDFSFSGSWSCRLQSSGFHSNHIHDQGWISSAYYVSLPDEVAAGGQGGLKFGESRFNLGERDRPARVVGP
ncbi:MAG TPA: tetratricopeptide repeat protein, partial [Casimicrobiaceae bacterium]